MSWSSCRRGLLMMSLPGALLALGCQGQPERETEAPTTVHEAAPETSATPAPAGAESEVIRAARTLGTATDSPVVSTESGLQYLEVAPGEGAAAKAGQTAVVHYTGWLPNGKKFDSSLDAGQPFDFLIGAGQVIKGWDEGLVGMKPGGVRKLIVPPELGYGSRGVGPIPPDSTLIFEVKLLKLQ